MQACYCFIDCSPVDTPAYRRWFLREYDSYFAKLQDTLPDMLKVHHEESRDRLYLPKPCANTVEETARLAVVFKIEMTRVRLNRLLLGCRTRQSLPEHILERHRAILIKSARECL